MTVEPTEFPDDARLGSLCERPWRSSNTQSGVVHGPVVQAGVIQSLTMAHPPQETPRQLPPPVRLFTDRARELVILSEAVGTDATVDPPRIVVVTGISGIGKSALALQWSWSQQSRFGGGLLYADLAAYRHRGGVAINDIMAGFLRAIGVYDQFMPKSLAERTAEFRSRTASSPVLVLLENADQAAQVRPFLPSSRGSVVLVTSQSRLSGLTIDDAYTVQLDRLATGSAIRLLLERIPEPTRGAIPETDLRTLVELCGGLPLALRVVGARLAEPSRWPTDRLLTWLADEGERLSRLSDESLTLSEVFDSIVGGFDHRVRLVYRRLGVNPGPDLSLAAIAELAESEQDEVHAALEQLYEANLVENSSGQRYRLHDLIRLHARRLASAEEDDLDSIRHRIIAWYLSGARAADEALLGPNRWRTSTLVPQPWQGPVCTSHTAMAWCDAERVNLVESIRLASEASDHLTVLAFCEALWPYHHGRKTYADWVEADLAGIESAIQVGDRLAEVRMRNQLARAYIELGRRSAAEEMLNKALASAAHVSARMATSVVHESFGVLRQDEGNWAAAEQHFRDALSINREISDSRGIAIELYHLGQVFVSASKSAEAVEVLREAFAIATELHDEMSQARIEIVLGAALLNLGQIEEARAVLRNAVEVTRRRGQYVKETQALEGLLAVARSTRDTGVFDDTAVRLEELYAATGRSRPTDPNWLRRDWN